MYYLPQRLLRFLYLIITLVVGARMAFLDYNVIGESTFVGVDNFAAVLFDSVFWDINYTHGRVCFLEPLVGISTTDHISDLFERITARECLVPRIILFACLSLGPDRDVNVENVL